MGEYLLPFFVHSVNIGYRASIAVIVVMLAGIILNWIRTPKKYICYLWYIVFIRLVFRFSSRAFSAFCLPGQSPSGFPSPLWSSRSPKKSGF